MELPRSRWVCLTGLIATIALGLATRDSSIAWPVFISLHAGDALWSVAMYLGIAWLLPRLSAVLIFVVVLGCSYSVELSQLLDWHWLNSLRETVLGQLLLGTGFQWLDFLRYSIGTLMVFSLDILYVTYLEKRA